MKTFPSGRKQKAPSKGDCRKVMNRWLKWWALRDSNSRHSRCKRDALPTELNAHSKGICTSVAVLLAYFNGAIVEKSLFLNGNERKVWLMLTILGFKIQYSLMNKRNEEICCRNPRRPRVW